MSGGWRAALPDDVVDVLICSPCRGGMRKELL